MCFFWTQSCREVQICLFNRSFELSEFPTAWKEAMVIPIFKKGSHTDPGNYRPIALLPIISKVLERIVHDKLSSFLQTWLHDSQSGFKKGDGTVPQLLRLCQEWSRHVDNSAYVGILFFYLRKAFDRVWHDGLLSKLEAAGIRGSAFAWMKSFLTSRRQITTVEGCTSAPAEIGAGVPQGAIISPLLFSVYVNDISSATPANNINLFADDTSAYVSSQAPSVLNSDQQTTADSLSSWFSRWHLSVHPAKTVCMVLRSTGMPPCQLNIKINGNHIAQVTRHRHLGVTFNERLSWKDHVHDVLKKSAKKIGLLRRLGRQLSSTVVRDLYAFSIRPGIEYGSIVWSGLSSSDAARLERLNRSAARLITKTSPSSDLYISRAPSGSCRFAEPWYSLPYGPMHTDPQSVSRTPSSAPSASPFAVDIAWQAETVTSNKSPLHSCSAPKQILLSTLTALSSSHHLEQICCRYSQQRPPFSTWHCKLF